MKSPCIKCPLQGCGAFHDYCYKLKVFNNWRHVAATRRNAEQEAQKTVIERAVRLKRGMDRK